MVPAVTCAPGSGAPASISRPRSTRRAITTKSLRMVSPGNAGSTVLERGSREVHPCGSLTVRVAPPSKARNRNFPSDPVRTTWVRSPWASVTCAIGAPAPPRSPTRPSTIAGRVADSSRQRRRPTRSVCPSEHHIARFLTSCKPRESLVLPHHLARIGSNRGRDSHALVVPHTSGSGVVGHERLLAPVEAPLEPTEVSDGQAHVDHGVFAHRGAVADVGVAARNPSECRGLELHEAVGSSLAGNVRAEAAFHRNEPEDE